MDFNKLGRIGAKAHWKKVNQPIIDYIKDNSSNFLKEKARIVGCIMGGGYITKEDRPASKQHHDVGFYPDDTQTLEIFLKDFEKVYLKKPRMKNLNNYFSVRVSSKPACDDLRTFGKFTSLEWKLPSKLKSKEEQIEWLRALFDCEAHVGRRQIQFQSVSKLGINSIKLLLQKVSITPKVYTYNRQHKGWNLNYILVICGRKNIIKYKDLIGFNHSKKQEKLNILAGVPER
jgi:hypothetical protein